MASRRNDSGPFLINCNDLSARARGKAQRLELHFRRRRTLVRLHSHVRRSGRDAVGGAHRLPLPRRERKPREFLTRERVSKEGRPCSFVHRKHAVATRAHDGRRKLPGHRAVAPCRRRSTQGGGMADCQSPLPDSLAPGLCRLAFPMDGRAGATIDQSAWHALRPVPAFVGDRGQLESSGRGAQVWVSQSRRESEDPGPTAVAPE
jgi:hypothetical protein